MNEIEFADRYLGQYRIRREEINPVYCPFCNGGSHRDKYTFFLNPNKHTYICHRGSCGATGTFNQLAKIYSERADYVVEMQRERFDLMNSKKEYKKPDMKLKNLSQQAVEYMNLRKITKNTITHFNIKSDVNGNIVFPFYDENGIHVLNKIRLPRKFIKGKDKCKIWQEGSGKPVLFNMSKVDKAKPIVITEGEWDCMSVFEAEYKNVISIPFGTENMDWINECWEWLEQCKEFILWFDSDAAGKRSSEKVAKKLGIEKCKEVHTDEKDANLVLFKYGANKIVEYIKNAEYFPIENLFRISDTKKKDVERILYGNRYLDYNLGGCRMGELVVWTGKRGGGKSTFLNQTLIDTVDQKTKCFIYSGELSNSKVKQWLDRQIAGEKYIVTFKDELTGREEYGVHPEVEKIITEWYADYVYCYGDDGSNDIDILIQVMLYAYKRYDVKRFIIDNLKTIKTEKKEDYYRQQAFIVNRLKNFANRYDVHVDLVAHPRKTNNDVLEDEDIAGSSDIIDLADSVIVVSRITQSMIEKAEGGKKNKMESNDSILVIRKNREYGEIGEEAYYKFDPKSKRFYGNAGLKSYSWEERIKNQNFMINIYDALNWDEEECPF